MSDIIRSKLEEMKADRGRLLTRLSKLRSSLETLNERIRAYELVLSDMGEELIAASESVEPSAETEGELGGDDVSESREGDRKITVAEAVRRAVALMESTFDVGDITAAIKAEFPEALEGVDLASVGAALSRMAKHGSIIVAQKGQGRRPATYRRSSSASEAAPNEKPDSRLRLESGYLVGVAGREGR